MMACLIDTCIIIDYLRGNPAIDFSHHEIVMNPVVELEILQGVRNKREQKEALRTMGTFKRIDYSPECFDLAKILILRYSLSHSLRLPDALIASSCLIYDLPLWTYNIKDFAFIEGMKIYNP